MRIIAALLMCLMLAGCGSYTTRTREIGYKGKAKVDAYLAASRFLERCGFTVVSKPGWPKLETEVAILIVPAEVMSTEAYIREVGEWVANGGHLLCLVEWGESYQDEWRAPFFRFDGDEEVVPEALGRWLKDLNLEVGPHSGGKLMADKVDFNGESYQVFAESHSQIAGGKKAGRVFDQVEYGHGLVTVLTDARPFRNRHISDHDHAELLLALVNSSPYRGSVVIVRDAAISLWTLVWRHGWMVVIGLLVVTIFWLWKNMPRFGPLRREEERSTVRDYDHHLEALGDFQWRLDRGAAMLRPLRDSAIERASRLSASLHRDSDLFEWIAQRADMTRDRAERAMTHERPPDAASFARVIADLQKIHLSLT